MAIAWRRRAPPEPTGAGLPGFLRSWGLPPPKAQPTVLPSATIRSPLSSKWQVDCVVTLLEGHTREALRVWAELLSGNCQRFLRRNCPNVMYVLLYLKRITSRDLLHSTWSSAQRYVPAWVAAGLGGGWIHGYVWLSPFTVRLNNTVKWLHPNKKWFWC